jgi:hypothetical protein
MPPDQRWPALERLFDSNRDVDRAIVAESLARHVIEDTQIASSEALAGLFSLSAAGIRGMDDPAVKLVVQAVDELEPLNERADTINRALRKLRPLLISGMFEWKGGGPFYPDANRTLRFTYGEIKGYRPRDAVSYEHMTSFTGVIESDTGQGSFAVPPKLKELHAKRDFNDYTEARIKDVPVDFLATTDTTGGNSGSPLMNGRCEMIGLVFDVNYEALGSDYVYTPALCRTIAVDIRYVMFITDKFAGGSNLFREMHIRRSGGIAHSW